MGSQISVMLIKLKAGHLGMCIIIPLLKQKKTCKATGHVLHCCFPPCPGRAHLQALPRQVQTRLLWSLKVSLWPLGQKLGLLSPSLTVTFPSTVFYSVTRPSRFLMDRVQGIVLALRFSTLTLPNTSTLNSSHKTTPPWSPSSPPALLWGSPFPPALDTLVLQG